MSHALNTIGCARWNVGGDWQPSLAESLRVALDAGMQEEAGRAYCNLQALCMSSQMFVASERYFRDGIAFCEDRELGVFATHLTGDRAGTLMTLGEWGEAETLARWTLGRPNISAINRLNPLHTLGTIQARRGDPIGEEALADAMALAHGTAEQQRIVTECVTGIELAWLVGRADDALREARNAYDGAIGHVDPWALGFLIVWRHRLGAPVEPPSDLPEPFALEIAGDWRGAAAA